MEYGTDGAISQQPQVPIGVPPRRKVAGLGGDASLLKRRTEHTEVSSPGGLADLAAGDPARGAKDQIVNKLFDGVGMDKTVAFGDICTGSESNTHQEPLGNGENPPYLGENSDFVNRNHELALRCAAAGWPVFPWPADLPKDNGLFVFDPVSRTHSRLDENATTDVEKLTRHWRAHPGDLPAIRPGVDFYSVAIGPTATLPQPLAETLHFTDGDGRTCYLYADNEAVEWRSTEPGEDIELDWASYAVLSPDTVGPLVLVPLPKWLVDYANGEEFRGDPLDSPEAVAAAKRFLRGAAPPREVSEDELLERLTPAELAQMPDRCASVSQQIRADRLSDICQSVFCLGISEARARVLIDLYWNERGTPPMADIGEAILSTWQKPDWESIPRRLRWRYRETDWLAADDVPEDLLLGEFLSAGTRLLMYAPTGVGKTTFAMALAIHVAAGTDFLHWQGSGKPRRVLYIDGEMSKALMRDRFKDAVRRAGKQPEGMEVLSGDHTPDLPALDTQEGQRWLNRYIEDHGSFDLIVFDNIASLLAGSMIGPDSWKATLPWIKGLTARGIAQIWVHHTGHDVTHAYGDSTREFIMDTVVRLEPVPHVDVGFKMVFQKARLRGPSNRADFEPAQIQLLADKWQDGSDRKTLFEKTLTAHDIIGDDAAIGHATFAKLLADGDTDAATWRNRLKVAVRAKSNQHLLVAKDGVKLWRVTE